VRNAQKLIRKSTKNYSPPVYLLATYQIRDMQAIIIIKERKLHLMISLHGVQVVMRIKLVQICHMAHVEEELN